MNAVVRAKWARHARRYTIGEREKLAIVKTKRATSAIILTTPEEEGGGYRGSEGRETK